MTVDEPDVLPHSDRIFDNCYYPAKIRSRDCLEESGDHG
jgi:hypothetical protein